MVARIAHTAVDSRNAYEQSVWWSRLLGYAEDPDDPNLPGEMQVTVTLKQVSVGTELTIVQEGIPDAIPAEACYLGWQESLRNLARLVEPNINQ